MSQECWPPWWCNDTVEFLIEEIAEASEDDTDRNDDQYEVEYYQELLSWKLKDPIEYEYR